MTLMLFSMCLFFVFAPSNENEHNLLNESIPHSISIHIEPDVDQDEFLEDDCRYSEESIRHRDLSDYVVLDEMANETRQDLNTDQFEPKERSHLEQSEEDQGQPILTRPSSEGTE